MQIMSMCFNDAMLIMLWVIFFKQFPSVHGWCFEDSALLLAISWTAFSILSFWCGGLFDFSRLVCSGQLDQWLVLPRPVLWHIATSKCNFWDLGTFLVTIGLFYVSGYVTVATVPLIIILLMSAALVTFNFIVMIHTCSFFCGDITYAIDKLLRTFFDLVFFPPPILNGFLRFVIIFIIPAFFVGVVPVSLIKEFQWTAFGTLLMFCVCQTFCTAVFFKAGLRRYESGNLINVKL